MPRNVNSSAALVLAAALCGTPAFAFRAGPGARPLPDIASFLKQVERNQARVEQDRERYSFTDVEEQDDASHAGSSKSKKTKQYEVFFLNGNMVRRLVKKNGKALDAAAQKKEDARVARQIKKYEKEAARKKDQSDNVVIGTFLRASLFAHPRWETLGGREVLAFDFQPNPAFKPKTTAGRVVHGLAGVMWVDGATHEVVRLQAAFDSSYNVGGGLLGAIEKGTTVTLEQKFVDGNVWLPSYSAIHARVRLFFFKGLHLNMVNQFSDYRVFNVQTLNKLSSPAKAKR